MRKIPTALTLCGLLSASLSVAQESESPHAATPPNRVSLFQVPLQCPAAPQIGCGSAAKPILLALEREPTVSEAWLNRAGTAIAVVWKEDTEAKSRSDTVKKVFEPDNLDEKKLTGASRKKALKEFLSGKGWYRGRDVDRLSEEEAGVIAGRLVRRILKVASLTDEKEEDLQKQLGDVIARRLTGQLPDRGTMEEEVLKVFRQHFTEKEVSRLREALKDFRPARDEP